MADRLLFDGECGFCRRWILRWRRLTGERVEYVAFQDLEELPPGVSPDDLRHAVHRVGEDGSVQRGAEAVLRCLDRAPRREVFWAGWPLVAYRRLPGFAPLAEVLYRRVADHRSLLSRMERGWSGADEPVGRRRVRALFLRGLALVYAVAFASLWVQVEGLIGGGGILPVEETLARYAAQAEGLDVHRLRLAPTLLWLSPTDAALHATCAVGIALSLALFFGLAPGPSCLGLWVLYLSLASVGESFLSFQWDALLLEMGLIAVFHAPWRPRLSGAGEPPLGTRILLFWLLWRLMLSSGVVKLASGDVAWADLSALTHHYQTQPLPTVLGWWAHQLPAGVHATSCAVMFAVELLGPLLMLGPRRARLGAFWAFLALQLAIALTGNYGFFNLATVVLCLTLLDDRALARVPPWRGRRGIGLGPLDGAVQRLAAALAAIVLGGLGALHVARLGGRALAVEGWRDWGRGALVAAGPLRAVNSYGLFQVMTTLRAEVVVRGSDDGETWRTYRFRYKPDEVDRAPVWCGVHMPRLDWQLWFVPFGWFEGMDPMRASPWLGLFLLRLLEGAPEVTALLAEDPFDGRPPRWIRADLVRYRFSGPDDLRARGVWWEVEPLGELVPPVSLPPR